MIEEAIAWRRCVSCRTRRRPWTPLHREEAVRERWILLEERTDRQTLGRGGGKFVSLYMDAGCKFTASRQYLFFLFMDF